MEELLAAFDALRAEHEGMDAAKFNHDGTYKGGINQVRRGGTAHPHTAPPLLSARADPQRCAFGTPNARANAC